MFVAMSCRTMCPVWLLAAVALAGVAQGDISQCWEHLSCQELSSQSSIKVANDTFCSFSFLFKLIINYFKFIIIIILLLIIYNINYDHNQLRHLFRFNLFYIFKMFFWKKNFNAEIQ